MGAPTVKTLAADRQIRELLASGPLTAREVSKAMGLAILTTWCDKHDIDLDLLKKTGHLGSAVLLANISAGDRGLVFLHSWQVHARLASMERRGLVARMQIPGHRPMLWRLP